jgi:DNA polymerase delta subunit 1
VAVWPCLSLSVFLSAFCISCALSQLSFGDGLAGLRIKGGTQRTGVRVRTHFVATEAALLQAFEQQLLDADPDFITGTDLGHAMQLLKDRAELLGLNWGTSFGRGRGALKIKKKQTYTAAWVKKAGRQSGTGNAESKAIGSAGRLFLDVREAAQQHRQLRTYAFTEITEALLGHSSPWFSGDSIAAKMRISSRADTDAERSLLQLLGYSLGLAEAALGCVEVMQCVTEAATLARVTGQPLQSVWTRGKMLQAVNLLLRASRQRGYLVPDVGTSRAAAAHESPLQLDPEVGLHSSPVCVLDFASLYPSLIIGYNMSFDTLLPGGIRQAVAQPAHETVALPEQGKEYSFVSKDQHKGVVPEILEMLLEERADVKLMLRDELDPAMRVIYDLRQKALKVAANAFYGFLGAQSSRLRCLPIAECTLALGRSALLSAKRWIEQDDGRDTPQLPRARTRVIYGDTDSVFVLYEGLSAAQATMKAKAAAEMVTRRLDRAPIRLLFEKSFARLCIQQIKRYVGAVADSPEIDIKGFEPKQRDTPPYIAMAVKQILHALVQETDTEISSMGVMAAAQAAIHSVLGQRHHLLDLAFTRALKMWESGGARSSPSKAAAAGRSPTTKAFKQAVRADIAQKVKLYDAQASHVALASRIEQRYASNSVTFESGQRVSFLYCTVAATQAKRASTKSQTKPPLFERATDPLQALVERRSVDWEEALRQLGLPLARIFSLPGVLHEGGSWDTVRRATMISYDDGTA